MKIHEMKNSMITERARLKMSQAEFSKIIGIAPATISRIENGVTVDFKCKEIVERYFYKDALSEINLISAEVGIKLREKRKEMGLTQHQLSKILGGDNMRISCWERGQYIDMDAYEIINNFLNENKPQPQTEISMPAKTKAMILAEMDKLTEQLQLLEIEQIEQTNKLYTIVINPDLREFISQQCGKYLTNENIQMTVNTIIQIVKEK
jgi:transcriptional regulator with XRE-family HTH domain